MYCPPNYSVYYPKYHNFVHYHVHQRQTLETIFSKMNPVPTTLHLLLRFTSVLSSLVSLGVLRGFFDTRIYHLLRFSLFGSVQTGTGAQPASNLMGTRGYFPEVRGRRVKLPIRHRLAPWQLCAVIIFIAPYTYAFLVWCLITHKDEVYLSCMPKALSISSSLTHHPICVWMIDD
jgi:hypothetical protein